MKNEEKIKEKTKFNLIITNIYDPANDGKTKEEVHQQDRKTVNEILKDIKRPDIERTIPHYEDWKASNTI